jgi:hypothetical protein
MTPNLRVHTRLTSSPWYSIDPTTAARVFSLNLLANGSWLVATAFVTVSTGGSLELIGLVPCHRRPGTSWTKRQAP